MKVLIITSYEDHKEGCGPTSVVEMPDGMHEDDAFVLWLRDRVGGYENVPKEKCLQAMYDWGVYTVNKIKELI